MNDCETKGCGSWKREGDVVIYTDPFGEKSVYQKESLEFALNNVKANRNSYATWEAYDRAVSHFEHGLCFLSNEINFIHDDGCPR